MGDRQIVLSRGTSVMARPGFGVQFNTLPHHAVVLPLPENVKPGHVINTFTGARIPQQRATMVKTLHYCGFEENVADDVLDELTRAGIMEEPAPATPLPVLRTGQASEKLVRTLQREGVSCSDAERARTLISGARDGTVALLPGSLFLHTDLHFMLMQAKVAHYPGAAVDGSVVMGPLVIPGRTPCLNCVDMSYQSEDAQWKSIRLQAAGRPMTADPTGMEAAALTMANLVTAHIIPWQQAGCPEHAIPEILLHRLEYRLAAGEVHKWQPEWNVDCPSCHMAHATRGSA